MLILVEVQLTDGVNVTGSRMIAPGMITEVEELGQNAKLFMASGNEVLVTGASFAALLNLSEDNKYLKITMPTEGEVKEVVGELVDEDACC